MVLKRVMFLQRSILFLLSLLFLSANLSYSISKGMASCSMDKIGCCRLSVHHPFSENTPGKSYDHENNPCESEETEKEVKEVFLSTQLCLFTLTDQKVDYYDNQLSPVSNPFFRIFSPPPEYLPIS